MEQEFEELERSIEVETQDLISELESRRYSRAQKQELAKKLSRIGRLRKTLKNIDRLLSKAESKLEKSIGITRAGKYDIDLIQGGLKALFAYMGELDAYYQMQHPRTYEKFARDVYPAHLKTLMETEISPKKCANLLESILIEAGCTVKKKKQLDASRAYRKDSGLGRVRYFIFPEDRDKLRVMYNNLRDDP